MRLQRPGLVGVAERQSREDDGNRRDVDEASGSRELARPHDISRSLDVAALESAPGRPVGDERGGVVGELATADSDPERGEVVEVAADGLGTRFGKRRR